MGEHVAPTTPAKKKRSNIFWNIVKVFNILFRQDDTVYSCTVSC